MEESKVQTYAIKMKTKPKEMDKLVADGDEIGGGEQW